MSESAPQFETLNEFTTHPVDAAIQAAALDEAATMAPARPHRFARFITATAFTAAAIQGVSTEYTGDPWFAAETTVEFVTDYSAPPVPQAIQDKVNHIVDQPTTKELAEIIPAMPGNKNIYRNYALRKAKECGLTTFDPTTYEQALETAQTPADAVKIFSDYTTQLGFSTVLHETTDFSDTGWGVSPVKTSDIDLEKLKLGIVQLFNTFALIPKEVLQFADLHQRRIVQNLGTMTTYDGAEAQPAGESNVVSGNIYIPIDQIYAGDYSLDAHEIGHRIDYKMNGLWGMFHDKQFAALNPPDFTYGQANQETEFQYDLTDEPEDKATKFQYMLTATDANTLYGPDQLKNKKYRLLLARLEQHVPGVTRYLFEISGGNDIEQLLVGGK